MHVSTICSVSVFRPRKRQTAAEKITKYCKYPKYVKQWNDDTM